MKTFRYLATMLFIALAIVPAVAQKRDVNLTISVTGPNGNAIKGVAVTLKQTDYAVSYGSITLNEQGSATVKVYKGNHSLEASALGYSAVKKESNVTATPP